MITVYASAIEVDDFIPVYGRSGLHRVTAGPHRNVFSECYYYVNVTLSDGSKIGYIDTERVTLLRP